MRFSPAAQGLVNFLLHGNKGLRSFPERLDETRGIKPAIRTYVALVAQVLEDGGRRVEFVVAILADVLKAYRRFQFGYELLPVLPVFGHVQLSIGFVIIPNWSALLIWPPELI